MRCKDLMTPQAPGDLSHNDLIFWGFGTIVSSRSRCCTSSCWGGPKVGRGSCAVRLFPTLPSRSKVQSSAEKVIKDPASGSEAEVRHSAWHLA
jgi:hypothetical protein